MLNKLFNSHITEEQFKIHLELIKQQCDKIKDYMNIEVFSFEELEECQVGYRVDPDGSSLVTDDEDTWDGNWVVIAYETVCGDPIIVDFNDVGYSVSLLIHGMDSWDSGSYIAQSMESFSDSLKQIVHFLTEKQAFEGNRAIRNKECEALLNSIVKKCGFTDAETWLSLMSPLFEIAEQYEQEMQTKVQAMKKDGKKISDIAELLNISLKDVYGYSKNS